MAVNPYESVDWSSVLRIPSVAHAHMTTQTQFDNAYTLSGIRHFPISNYYPSKPAYPLSEYFNNVPADAIGCPNAEHFAFSNPPSGRDSTHLLTPGSLLATGTEDTGYNQPWERCVDEAKAQMLFPDGGCVIIAHPSWSLLSADDCKLMLDYDDIVVGIEVWNWNIVKNPNLPDHRRLPDFDLWDTLLSTGRRVWGYFAPDHFSTTWQGRNILLVDEATEEACARAYRNGNFYGSLLDTSLMFTEISVGEGSVTAKTNEAAEIKWFTEMGEVQTTPASESTLTITPDTVFARCVATDGNDTIYSQPIIFSDDIIDDGGDESENRKRIVLLLK